MLNIFLKPTHFLKYIPIKIKKYGCTTILILTFLITINYFNQKNNLPPITVSKQDGAININKKIFEYINLGQKRMIVAWLWIQTLIESDLEQYKKNDLNSWIYLRLDTILTLDPFFLEGYQFGGTYLSIIKKDFLGAQNIFKRGLQKFPDDYNLNFNAGFMYYFNLNNYEEAYRYLSHIQHYPQAFKFLPSLVARIKAEKGDLKNAYQLLLYSYKAEPDESPFKKKYFHSLYSIRAELDLECLNRPNLYSPPSSSADSIQLNTSYHSPVKCNYFDLENRPYIKNKNGKYMAQREWQSFRLFKNQGIK